MITAIYDTYLQSWSVENTGVDPTFVDVQVGVRNNGSLPVDLRGLRIYVTGCDVFKGISTDSPYIFEKRLTVLPNIPYTIFFRANDILSEITITPPKTEKPEGDYVWCDVSHTWLPTELQGEKNTAIIRLTLSDAKMARAFEDLVELLGVEESLPQPVKDNLAYRRSLRSVISGG